MIIFEKRVAKHLSKTKNILLGIFQRSISTFSHKDNNARKLLGQWISRFFLNTSFFLQGRMDIESKSLWYDEEFNKQTGGFFLPRDDVEREIINLYTWDQVRRDMLILLLRSIIERQIQGDIVEVGVYQGLTAKMIHYYLPDRKLYLFDTFDLLDEKDLTIEKRETGMEYNKEWFINTSIEQVLKYIGKKNDNIIIHQGYFPDSIPEEFNSKKFAFVHIDVSLYKPTLDALNTFFDKMSCGGFIVLHDYNSNPSVRKSTDEFIRDKTEILIPMPDKSGSVLIVKQ